MLLTGMVAAIVVPAVLVVLIAVVVPATTPAAIIPTSTFTVLVTVVVISTSPSTATASSPATITTPANVTFVGPTYRFSLARIEYWFGKFATFQNYRLVGTFIANARHLVVDPHGAILYNVKAFVSVHIERRHQLAVHYKHIMR